MNWLFVIIAAAAVCGILGYFLSDGNDRTGDAASGCMAGGMGCAYVIFNLFIFVLGIVILFKLAAWLFF